MLILLLSFILVIPGAVAGTTIGMTVDELTEREPAEMPERVEEQVAMSVLEAATPMPTPSPVPTAIPTPVPTLEPIPEPEPVVTPEPFVATAVPADKAVLVGLVQDTFPDNERMWRHVVWAESIGEWNKNWECTVYGGCWSPTSDCGLMQINQIHWKKFADKGWVMSVDCFDPVKNLVIAREIYNSQGSRAWTSY